jgi:hypothetical protein
VKHTFEKRRLLDASVVAAGIFLMLAALYRYFGCRAISLRTMLVALVFFGTCVVFASAGLVSAGLSHAHPQPVTNRQLRLIGVCSAVFSLACLALFVWFEASLAKRVVFATGFLLFGAGSVALLWPRGRA